MKKKVFIFSDVNYHGYKHINQYIADYANEQGYEVFFVERFVLNSLTFSRLKNILRGFYNKVTSFRLNVDTSPSSVRIVKVFNLPPLNSFFNFITKVMLNKGIPKVKSDDIVFIFAPTPSLSRMLEICSNVVYYCVHDSLQQEYNDKVRNFEKKLIKESKLVIFDNLYVAKRNFPQSLKVIPQLIEKGDRAVLIPSPVPDVFYTHVSPLVAEFDLVYYGSIHANIDTHLIRNLDKKGYKILIVTNDDLGFKLTHGSIVAAELDSVNLVNRINLAKAILFPYKNSKFMDTVTPAKLFQSIATGKVIYSSNRKQCEINEFIKSTDELMSGATFIPYVVLNLSCEDKEMLKNLKMKNVGNYIFKALDCE